MLNEAIKKLVLYGVENGLIQKTDIVYTINRLLEVLQLDDYENVSCEREENLGKILEPMLDYGIDKGLIAENSVVYRDLFDTKIMGCIMPAPSVIINEFRKRYEDTPSSATDYFYKLSMDSDYIRRYRVSKDIRWIKPSIYGEIDMSINLSKPEKDPKAIAAARFIKSSGYPQCLLCRESEGYAGRLNYPARQNHRIIPLKMNGGDWGLQYSPYVYYNEHCIVLNYKHIPMSIGRQTFENLFAFIRQFPKYFIGSNADLPIVGGSILTHDHYQGGCYQFAMEKAPVEEEFTIKGFEGVTAGIVKWPLSVIRLRNSNCDRVIELATHILDTWRGYTDEAAFVYAQTNGEPHNTITPIARMNGEEYELDLAMRNNITTEEYPLGVYHPHEQYHHIKKENIGLIEVMGLAILPSRLKDELEILSDYILGGNISEIRNDSAVEKHYEWVNEWISNYNDLNEENIMDILKRETGNVFVKVLEDAGVYKCTPEGREAFRRFIKTLSI
ncbi:UDP-glucose--hexose-1-phosphate uridylyltransferase [[Clostridium] fimetarium]|uniref:Galactose-1-phosphate uridylyltransferase n=1 Tax=[Clostridium] fimetarium TaxID=99656 RepID=A0A1I0NQ79_9FIRM|nr:UDP-glucose--hexose-1-phosphate uridylyltransferase [[Clostridium] fimetarium]SEW03469.1 UDPglucose--hexose-1-phosphate uridylyltransferase [[Clostridium] fimetarium]